MFSFAPASVTTKYQARRTEKDLAAARTLLGELRGLPVWRLSGLKRPWRGFKKGAKDLKEGLFKGLKGKLEEGAKRTPKGAQSPLSP